MVSTTAIGYIILLAFYCLACPILYYTYYLGRNKFQVRARSPYLSLLSGLYGFILIIMLLLQLLFKQLDTTNIPCLLIIIASHAYFPIVSVSYCLRAIKLLIQISTNIRNNHSNWMKFVKNRYIVASIITASLVYIAIFLSFLFTRDIYNDITNNNSNNCGIFNDNWYFIANSSFYVLILIIIRLQLASQKNRDEFDLSGEITMTCLLWIGGFTAYFYINIEKNSNNIDNYFNPEFPTSFIIIIMQSLLILRTFFWPLLQNYLKFSDNKGNEIEYLIGENSSSDSSDDEHHKTNTTDNTTAAGTAKQILLGIGNLHLGLFSIKSKNRRRRQKKKDKNKEGIKDELISSGLKSPNSNSSPSGLTSPVNHPNHLSNINRRSEGTSINVTNAGHNELASIYSLDYILHDSYLSLLFQAHAQRSLCVELVLFYYSIRDYNNRRWNLNSSIDLELGFKLGLEIYNKYIKMNSPFEINVDAKIKNNLKAIFENPSINAAKKKEIISKDQQARMKLVLVTNNNNQVKLKAPLNQKSILKPHNSNQHYTKYEEIIQRTSSWDNKLAQDKTSNNTNINDNNSPSVESPKPDNVVSNNESKPGEEVKYESIDAQSLPLGLNLFPNSNNNHNFTPNVQYINGGKDENEHNNVVFVDDATAALVQTNNINNPTTVTTATNHTTISSNNNINDISLNTGKTNVALGHTTTNNNTDIESPSIDMRSIEKQITMNGLETSHTRTNNANNENHNTRLTRGGSVKLTPLVRHSTQSGNNNPNGNASPPLSRAETANSGSTLTLLQRRIANSAMQVDSNLSNANNAAQEVKLNPSLTVETDINSNANAYNLIDDKLKVLHQNTSSSPVRANTLISPSQKTKLNHTQLEAKQTANPMAVTPSTATPGMINGIAFPNHRSHSLLALPRFTGATQVVTANISPKHHHNSVFAPNRSNNLSRHTSNSPKNVAGATSNSSVHENVASIPGVVSPSSHQHSATQHNLLLAAPTFSGGNNPGSSLRRSTATFYNRLENDIIFYQAQAEVKKLLETNIYHSFLRSKDFRLYRKQIKETLRQKKKSIKLQQHTSKNLTSNTETKAHNEDNKNNSNKSPTTANINTNNPNRAESVEGNQNGPVDNNRAGSIMRVYTSLSRARRASRASEKLVEMHNKLALINDNPNNSQEDKENETVSLDHAHLMNTSIQNNVEFQQLSAQLLVNNNPVMNMEASRHSDQQAHISITDSTHPHNNINTPVPALSQPTQSFPSNQPEINI